ncbi:hypothetical protein EBU71_12785 [bacterium]|jgi:hypothetical protein|nr:hypothetical protein [Candidatus Elulimicrobium humile]
MSTPPLQVQEAPKAPSYEAQGIQVPANIATPQATMDSVKNQQTQLNSVNNLSGGRTRRHSRGRGRKRGNKSVIRTYNGRKYQKGGAQEGGERVAIPQVGSTCTSGPQCSGAQNANFTAINNQAESSSINDAYAKGGGRRRFTRTRRRKPRHDQSLTTIIAYNIKKVLRKVLT